MNVVMALDQIMVKITGALVKVQIRDRFLKIIQYTIRFIISFYSNYPDKTILQKLEDSFMIVSNSRKFFRLFNSVGSIKQVIDILRHNNFTTDPIGTSLQVATQVFWGSFFFFDNIILYKRMFPRPNRSVAIERAFYSSWIGAEVCRLIHIIRVLMKTMTRQEEVRSYLAREAHNTEDKNGIPTQDPTSRLSQLNERARELKYNLGKSIAGVFVATNVHPDTRWIYNRFLSERNIVIKDFIVMVCAVTTSVLDIYENI